MIDIDNRELATLEEIGSLGKHSVLDGVVLHSLLQKRLVELSEEGWRLSSLGAETFAQCFGAPPPASRLKTATQTKGVLRRSMALAI